MGFMVPVRPSPVNTCVSLGEATIGARDTPLKMSGFLFEHPTLG